MSLYSFVFGTTATGNVPASELDSNFNAIATALQNNGLNFCAVGGSANAITLTPPAILPGARAAGQAWNFIPTATNTGAVQINVAGLGLVNALKRSPAGPVPLVAGDLVGGQEVTATDDGTQYVIDFVASSSGVSSIPSGACMPFMGSAAPTGFVLADGKTIGNGASGGTERANADTATLFSQLWNSFADAQLPVSTGRGVSAAADFAANKTITLPDLRGRTVFGLDNLGGVAANRITNAESGMVATTLGVAGGVQSTALTTAQLAAHTHNQDPNTAIVNGAGSGAPTSAGGDSTYGSVTGSAGSGATHTNMPPTFIAGFIIKL